MILLLVLIFATNTFVLWKINSDIEVQNERLFDLEHPELNGNMYAEYLGKAEDDT